MEAGGIKPNPGPHLTIDKSKVVKSSSIKDKLQENFYKYILQTLHNWDRFDISK